MLNGTLSLSVVVIGRNQASHLAACLKSVQSALAKYDAEIIYIDTDSTDGSMAVARAAGIEAISIAPPHPSAAIARNVGWKVAQNPFVLFLDGDTILVQGFVEKALKPFVNPAVAVVCGHRRERYPDASIYQRVFDIDWSYPTGQVDYCGGDAIMRRDVLEETKGFNGTLAAGEEPELCRRIRALGYQVIRLDTPMTLHDMDIQRFSQYWRRCYRTGLAYAEVSQRFKGSTPPLWEEESRHNLWKGGGMILSALAAAAALPWSWWPLALWLTAMAALAGRTAWRAYRKGNSLKTALLYGLHAHFQHIPMLCGQAAFFFGRRGALVEYH